MKKDEFMKCEVKNFIEEIKSNSLENEESILLSTGGARAANFRTQIICNIDGKCTTNNCGNGTNCSCDSIMVYGGSKLRPLNLKL